MRFHFYPDTDSLCIDLAKRPGTAVRGIAPGINLDFVGKGNLVGVDIDLASRVANLERLEAESSS